VQLNATLPPQRRQATDNGDFSVVGNVSIETFVKGGMIRKVFP
jgi:hypothetical protein